MHIRTIFCRTRWHKDVFVSFLWNSHHSGIVYPTVVVGCQTICLDAAISLKSDHVGIENWIFVKKCRLWDWNKLRFLPLYEPPSYPPFCYKIALWGAILKRWLACEFFRQLARRRFGVYLISHRTPLLIVPHAQNSTPIDIFVPGSHVCCLALSLYSQRSIPSCMSRPKEILNLFNVIDGAIIWWVEAYHRSSPVGLDNGWWGAWWHHPLFYFSVYRFIWFREFHIAIFFTWLY